VDRYDTESMAAIQPRRYPRDKGPLSLKDVESDVPLSSLRPASAFNASSYFILIALIYKIIYFTRPANGVPLCASGENQTRDSLANRSKESSISKQSRKNDRDYYSDYYCDYYVEQRKRSRCVLRSRFKILSPVYSLYKFINIIQHINYINFRHKF